MWTWDTELGCYQHSEPGTGGGVILRTAAVLRDAHGPLRPANTAAEQYLTLKTRSTPGPGNVFEWAWEHSRATGLTKQVIMVLAWNAIVAPSSYPAWPGYNYLTSEIAGTATVHDITEAVIELIALGELLLIRAGGYDLALPCPHVGYRIPAYHQLLTGHEVA